MLVYLTISKLIIRLFACMFIFLFGCNSHNEQISKLRDGPSANKMREKLKIPIIDTDMVKAETYSYERWESRQENPTEGTALHIFKNIFQYDTSENSLEEWDGILMKKNDSIIHQMNIYSKIKKKFVVIRTGELFVYTVNDPHKNRMDPTRQLREKEIDSILMNWKLYHLVMNK